MSVLDLLIVLKSSIFMSCTTVYKSRKVCKIIRESDPFFPPPPPNTIVTLTVGRCFVLFLLVGLDKELSLRGPQCLISFIRFCRDLVVVLSLLFESVEISVSGGPGLSIVC